LITYGGGQRRRGVERRGKEEGDRQSILAQSSRAVVSSSGEGVGEERGLYQQKGIQAGKRGHREEGLSIFAPA
jgi:hypothetical protein